MTAQEVKAIEAASRAARAAREEWDAMQAEIERLRVTLSRLPHAIGHMREGLAEITPGAHPQSWGDGYTTAQQTALNIVNAAIEQKAEGK